MANIDTTVEIEKAYIKDKLTYKKKHSKKTEYFYDIHLPGGTSGLMNKFVVALVYPFNYNATPDAEKKPEFNISWGDGTETVIRNKFVNMFSLHYDKIKPRFSVPGLYDIKLRQVPEKIHNPQAEALLYHEYDISGSFFTATNATSIKISIRSDEIVIPVAIDVRRLSILRPYVSGDNLTLPYPDENNYTTNFKNTIRSISDIICNVALSVGGELPPNLIGLPTEEYRDEFNKVFERGVYHPLDQKIAHIKNGVDGIDGDISTTLNTNNRSATVDYKSPSSMSMYALAGNNRFVASEVIASIGTANQKPIPIQAMLCAGVYDWLGQTGLKTEGIVINPLLAPSLINKGVSVNNSLLYVSITTESTKDNTQVHFVKNPFSDIKTVKPNSNGEYRLFSNLVGDETWGFFCNFFTSWNYNADNAQGGIVENFKSPWLNTSNFYNLLKSLPATVSKMKCIYRNSQSQFPVNYKHKLLDSIPKTVQEIENLIIFSNIEFYKKGFRVYRSKSEYNDLEAYNGGFRMLQFDNDDGVSAKYKNSSLKTIKNMVFCCDLYPEPLRLSDNTWTTNFDGVSLLYGFNSLEKVDGVFTYCRFKDTGYMRIRDICQRPQSNKYEDPSKVEYKPIELSRVMHWCDVINELAEDGDTNEHALNPFNGHMVKKQRSSWNITPNYKMRDFFKAMTGEATFNPD